MNNENTSSENLAGDVEASFGDAWISIDDIVNEGEGKLEGKSSKVISSESDSSIDDDVDTVEYDAPPIEVLRAGLEKNKSTVADMKLDELLVSAEGEKAQDAVVNDEKEGASDLFIRKTVALSKEERLEMLGFCDDDSDRHAETVILTDADLDDIHSRAKQLENDYAKQEAQNKSSKRLRGVITSDLRCRLVPDLDAAIPSSFHAMGDVHNDNEVKSEAMFGGQYFNKDQTMRYAPKSKPRRAFSAAGAAGEDTIELYLKLITFLTPFMVLIALLIWYILSE